MARIDPPSAREIFNEANLAPASLGAEDEGEVLRSINEFLPDVVRSANMEVDQASRPFDFPFDSETIVAASPWKAGNSEAVTQEIEDQQGQVRQWLLLAATARLVGRAVGRQRQTDNSRSPVKDRYDELVADRDRTREVALKAITLVSGAVPPEVPVVTPTVTIPTTSAVPTIHVW